MTLTKEEEQMIEREAYSLYPKEEPDSYFMDASILQRNAYISCRKECLQQLKAERERAGKLMEAFGKRCFYKGFEKCQNDDANCYTAWREEAGGLIGSLTSRIQ